MHIMMLLHCKKKQLSFKATYVCECINWLLSIISRKYSFDYTGDVLVCKTQHFKRNTCRKHFKQDQESTAMPSIDLDSTSVPLLLDLNAAFNTIVIRILLDQQKTNLPFLAWLLHG